MALLILNAGSSSLKYRLYRRTDLLQLAAGTLDGLRPGDGCTDHSQAFGQVLADVRHALPDTLYQRHGIRRFGFHGISHGYVAQRAAGSRQQAAGSRQQSTWGAAT